MPEIVSLSGFAVAAIGLLGVAAPGRLKSALAAWPVLTRLPSTVALRIGYGVLFVLAAPHCRLPALLRVVGVGEFAGAALLLYLGAERLQRFVAWWLARPPGFVRYWGSAAVGFGVLLVYASGSPA